MKINITLLFILLGFLVFTYYTFDLLNDKIETIKARQTIQKLRNELFEMRIKHLEIYL